MKLNKINIFFYAANRKLSDMTAELSTAQENARRFQDLLTAERRKQKSLKVKTNVATRESTASLVSSACSSHSMPWSRRWPRARLDKEQL